MSDPDWKDPHQYVDTGEIYENEIGELYGVRFVESSRAKVFAGAGSADPLNQRGSVGWKAARTAEILVPQYMVRVETTATP